MLLFGLFLLFSLPFLLGGLGDEFPLSEDALNDFSIVVRKVEGFLVIVRK